MHKAIYREHNCAVLACKANRYADKMTVTGMPAALHSSIVCRVPRDCPSQKARSASACVAISRLRRNGAPRP